ncbi:GTP-binding protein [Cyclospora cayetanensis]|uniref:GTP-binding protein n=1 Tax=Cyclospora cayetanensis TaxID=88456 RepID=A0A1D3D7N2_9EIME|nr:GTP-binding protein [Cyclospora cayetanensis]
MLQRLFESATNIVVCSKARALSSRGFPLWGGGSFWLTLLGESGMARVISEPCKKAIRSACGSDGSGGQGKLQFLAPGTSSVELPSCLSCSLPCCLPCHQGAAKYRGSAPFAFGFTVRGSFLESRRQFGSSTAAEGLLSASATPCSGGPPGKRNALVLHAIPPPSRRQAGSGGAKTREEYIREAEETCSLARAAEFRLLHYHRLGQKGPIREICGEASDALTDSLLQHPQPSDSTPLSDRGIAEAALLRLRRIDRHFFFTKAAAGDMRNGGPSVGSPSVGGPMRPPEGPPRLEVLDKTQLVLQIFASRVNNQLAGFQLAAASLDRLSAVLLSPGTPLCLLARALRFLPATPWAAHLEASLKGPLDKKGALREILRLKRTFKEKIKKEEQQLAASLPNRKGLPVVGLVGYSSSGKTALLNRLCGTMEASDEALCVTLGVIQRRCTLRGLAVPLDVYSTSADERGGFSSCEQAERTPASSATPQAGELPPQQYGGGNSPLPPSKERGGSRGQKRGPQEAAACTAVPRCEFFVLDSVGFVDGIAPMASDIIHQGLQVVAAKSTLLLLVVDPLHPRWRERRDYALQSLLRQPLRLKRACDSACESESATPCSSSTPANTEDKGNTPSSLWEAVQKRFKGRLLEVWTKADKIETQEALEAIQHQLPPNAVLVSSVDGTGIYELAHLLRKAFEHLEGQEEALVLFDAEAAPQALQYLHRHTTVYTQSLCATPDGRVSLRVTASRDTLLKAAAALSSVSMKFLRQDQEHQRLREARGTQADELPKA